MRIFSGHMLQLKRFLTDGIWHSPPASSGALAIYGRPILRMAVLTARGARDNRCALRASALTLYTLLSLVPVAAMAFGIAKGFGFEQRLQTVLMARFAGQEEVLQYVISFAHSLLENTRGGVVAGIGVAALFWAVVKVLGHIESALNHIWKVPSRTWERRLGDYLAVMLIGPLLLITASSATVFLQAQVTAMADRFDLLRMVGPALALAIKLGPYLLMWLLFTLIYVVMPNTHVPLISGLVAGILAGTTYQLLQLAYIDLQLMVSNYNAVYGSFAALPLFLVWLQLSWLIVLVGAEAAYAHQHHGHHHGWNPAVELSHRDRQLIAVRLCRAVVAAFSEGGPAPEANQLATRLEISPAAVQALLDVLAANRIVSRVADTDGAAAGYLPARDPATLTLAHVLAAVDLGTNGQAQLLRPEEGRSQAALDTYLAAQTAAPANMLIKDI
ncbi:MAG: YhjD/YihY/BrkB family envelope integrity protein [Desulfosarcinaceae bacterium]|nr:YhjD/YihY/BrkB family envelope integrity protein [Desulfosarcinaceae bacterium]